MTALDDACAIVARKDETPLRIQLFEQLATRDARVRAIRTTWTATRGTPVATAMLAGLAAARFWGVHIDDPTAVWLGCAQYRNEERQLEDLQRSLPAVAMGRVRLDGGGAAGRWSSLPVSRRALSDAWDRLDEARARHGFLVAARLAETVGYHLRMRAVLEEHPARAVVVSSDTNPYAVALLAAARELGRRTCFVTHGHVAEGPPPLTVDLALLDGEAVQEVYARAGPVGGEVVLRGSEGAFRPMDTTSLASGCRTLGVFLSILLDWREVGRRLQALRDALRPKRIVLRLHPNLAMRDPHWARHLDLRDVEVSDGERVLTEDAARCDLVVSGNSSAHLSVLKAGVPTAYVAGLDLLSDDYYGFVAQGIVPQSLDPEAVGRFYAEPGWVERFRRFDAAYPDREEECDRAVRVALARLVAG